ncbi:ABC transporter permease [Vogesella indigofera]|uniref:ABC transporter permease n=1 Tax=Vogesella indigofera TaxID=45465 RepID=UPI0035B43143
MIKKGRSPWRIQRSVIYALFLREIRGRFGKYRLGYLWAVLQPLLHILAMALIFGHASKKGMPEVDYLVLLTSGFVPWFFFSQTVNKCMSAVDGNRSLFSYRQVKPIDAILARMQVEFVTYAVLMMALLSVGWLLGRNVSMADPVGVLCSYLLLILIASAFGTVFCIAAAFSDDVPRFVPILMRPLYFVSGLFFPLSVIPPDMRYLFDWNPILHFVELSRGHWFSSYPAVITTYDYLVKCVLVAMFLALLLYRRFRIRLVTTV